MLQWNIKTSALYLLVYFGNFSQLIDIGKC